MKKITIIHNAVNAKILDNGEDLSDIDVLVSELLSYYVEGAEYTYAFKSGSGWNGRSSFYTFTTRSFPAGFSQFVAKYLRQKGYVVDVIGKNVPKPLGDFNPIVDEFGNDNPDYDYQIKTLRRVEKYSRGIVQVATGGGKTKIAKLIYGRYKRKTLFLTTRGLLMYQMKEDVEKNMGVKVGVIGDGNWNPINGLNVGMVQTFVAKLKRSNISAEMRSVIKENTGKKISREELMKMAKTRLEKKEVERKKTIKLLSLFEIVIGEEAHEAGGNSYYEILKYCTNANIRVALTATPFMRSAMEDNMKLMAAFGEKLMVISEKELIDKGILAKPIFKFITPKKVHEKLRKSSPWQRAYKFGIIEDDYRNQEIVDLVVKAKKRRLSSMILVQRKNHGERLEKMLEKVGVKVTFIRGENDQKERKTALNNLSNASIDAVIGTTILDVGVDVPAVGLIILAGGGKAEISLRQRIGRGLRRKKDRPNYAFIADFNDQINHHLKDHAKTRQAIISNTEGFKENILSDDEDFPWEIFDE